MLSEVENFDNNNSDVMSPEDKKKYLSELLADRESQRLADIAVRNEKRDKERASHESQDLFAAAFSSEYEKLTYELAQIENATFSPGVELEPLQTELQNIAIRIETLQKNLNESTNFLPVRSIGSYKSQITSLQISVTALRDALQPKKKFAFKLKRKPIQSTSASASPLQKQTQSQPAASEMLIKPLFECIKNQNIELQGEKVDGQDVILQNIVDSQVRILGCPATLHLLNVENSKVLIGPCSSSVFLEQCSNSTIVLACQQLRCHTSKNCYLFVHITSRGIIEDSTGLKIGPYSLSYPKLDDHFKAANLPRERNNWQKIDDFNWLSKTEKSPNYSYIPENEMQSFLLG